MASGTDSNGQITEHEEILSDVAVRVHSAFNGGTSKAPLDILWARKIVENSPLANHISAIKEKLQGADKHMPEQYQGGDAWQNFRPELEHSRLLDIKEPSGPFDAYSMELAQMTSNALEILQGIIQQRDDSYLPQNKDKHSKKVWTQPVVIVPDDAVGIMLQRASAGANGTRCTKSNVVSCVSPDYSEAIDGFGLTGVAKYPIFMGSWWMAPLMHDFDDWRQDYLSILLYSFFFEYNVDKVTGSKSLSPLGKQVAAIWDMPNLPEELQIRRSHMLCSMAFFDLKRRHEDEFCNKNTDGRTVWVHKDRDIWRDFKALDSAGFAHYLSFAPGAAGRDDMMLAGLVNDWIDLGPDLRYQECNSSVFALTRGSLAMEDLTKCYERTSLDLYKIAELADCYSSDFTPMELPDAKTIAVPRRAYSYQVRINDTEHRGSILLHITVCEAVQSGLLPASVVNYQIIVPLLLRTGRIDESTFLNYMDQHYCTHCAEIMGSGHEDGFSYAYSRAIAALVMEEWWSGLYFAVGIGSLIEAQPDQIANDR
ncbi:predicted protein [Sclerotinia sclerotiorum 1980 UF-70]|uniref:Uncharacterized protein n=1 Tax=Sclerotinia sclerotiorum (strain ATCC 18683 / 1980 / Ss-1) TaxID=665079 RepID=A7F2H7_SCLS1|nr:predicted protein [Sclerotinia sclerotiorum 1980 UF-70]EDN95919.1 predicted protein [Sclerotinia sclerotiorum 1980 UF-70]